MSMNRNERYEASKDWRRVSDVPVSKKTAEVIEQLACAHLAQGDAAMYKLAMSSLAKMQQTSNDSVLLRAIAQKLMPELEEDTE